MFGLEIVFWFWWILAILFLIFEVLITGFFFLWLAVSAFAVGIVLLLVSSTGLNMQLTLFALLTITSILSWRRFTKNRKPPSSDHPSLNQRGGQYIGRTFYLTEPIVNGHGKIMADGTPLGSARPGLPCRRKNQSHRH